MAASALPLGRSDCHQSPGWAKGGALLGATHDVHGRVSLFWPSAVSGWEDLGPSSVGAQIIGGVDVIGVVSAKLGPRA